MLTLGFVSYRFGVKSEHLRFWSLAVGDHQSVWIIDIQPRVIPPNRREAGCDDWETIVRSFDRELVIPDTSVGMVER